jgi:hypothetical protein
MLPVPTIEVGDDDPGPDPAATELTATELIVPLAGEPVPAHTNGASR